MLGQEEVRVQESAEPSKKKQQLSVMEDEEEEDPAKMTEAEREKWRRNWRKRFKGIRKKEQEMIQK